MIISYLKKARHIYTRPLKPKWILDFKGYKRFMEILRCLKRKPRKIH